MGKKHAIRQNLVRKELEETVKFVPTNYDKTFFEFENYVTEDVAEAVSIMMINKDVDKSFWNQKISNDSITIEPRKSLYWLSGGDREWVKLSNYTKSWIEVEQEYEEEFKFLVKWIINKSKTFGEVRENFIKYLNLPTLYEFAIERGFVK